MGPADKLDFLRKRNFPHRKLSRLITERSQINLLKQIEGSLPSIESAIRRYITFCELISARPSFQRQKRSSNGAVSSTTQLHFGHLRCACFFYRLDIDWLSPAVRHIAKGLAKCQNKSFRLPNFIRIPLVARIIGFEGFSADFAQVAYLSFLFSLRVPSETLALRRASPKDPIVDHTPQPTKALIKLSTIDGKPFLVMKFSVRKNLVYGCILRRPCFFSFGTSRAISLCPVHAFWPLIRARAQSGHLLPPRSQGGTSTALLKLV